MHEKLQILRGGHPCMNNYSTVLYTVVLTNSEGGIHAWITTVLYYTVVFTYSEVGIFKKKLLSDKWSKFRCDIREAKMGWLVRQVKTRSQQN